MSTVVMATLDLPPPQKKKKSVNFWLRKFEAAQGMLLGKKNENDNSYYQQSGNPSLLLQGLRIEPRAGWCHYRQETSFHTPD